MTAGKGARGKVVHVLRKYDPAEWGGTETHVAAVTARLGAMGFPCEVHAPRGPGAADRALAPEVSLRRYRAFLPCVGTSDARRALVANAGNIVSLDEPLRLGLDASVRLAHLHTMGRVGAGVRTAMRLTRRPYVLSIHGPLLAQRSWLAADTARRTRGTLDVGQPFGALLGARRVLEHASRVITFNEEERAAIAHRIGARAVRMDHGVDVERFGRGDLDRAYDRWPFLGDSPVVALVGRLCEQKNQLLAVRAFARAAPADHRLVLAGAATDLGYRERVEEEAARLGVRDRMHVLGNVDAMKAVPDLYARATAVLVPSTHEAFGLIVLEAMAAQRPVLFGRHSGLGDIAEALGHPASTVGSMEVAAWAEALRAMLTGSALRRATVEAGLALVRRRYDWRVVVEKLASLYDEALSEPLPL